jgi:hypothetical protein
MKWKFLTACLLFIYTAFSQQSFIVELPAVDYDRVDVPVRILQDNPRLQGAYYQLKEKGISKTILARSDGAYLVFIPSSVIPAGKKIKYQVTGVSKRPAEFIQFDNGVNGIVANVNGKPIFKYHSTTAMPPPDSPQYFQRSGFIHPLYTPSGAILTDDFPEGHVHQHAVFMAWANTVFRGKKIDFWNQHLQTGTVEHVQVLESNPGAVYGRLKVKLRHVGSGVGTILEETWTLTVYQLQKNFLFDIVSEQQNITSDTLLLQQYIYGGMAMRGSKYWNKHSSVYKGDSMQLVTSEGIQREKANHTHARFVTMHGKIQDLSGGVTVFDHRGNFRYPQAIRVHPDMPYWVYTPVFDGNFEIRPIEVYRSRYRYFVFNNMPDATRLKMLEENWMTY